MNISLVGSGSLALGLLYPWLQQQANGGRLSMLTRGVSPENRLLREEGRYWLRTPLRDVTVDLSEDLLLFNPDNLETRAARRCVDCLEGSDVVAVSVGVGQFRRVGQLIARACLQQGLPPLHLLAFENASGASVGLRDAVETEVEKLGTGTSMRELVAHASIPDRACKRRLDDQGLGVEVESFGEIVIEESARELFPENLDPPAPLPWVRHVPTEEVPLGERRKFWLVNGTHTALGVLCAESNRPRLCDGLADERIQAILALLHGEWVRTLQELSLASGAPADIFATEELEAHAARMFNRLRELPDWTVRDVLRELAEMEDLTRASPALHRLFQKLDDRLAEAVRIANDAGGVPVPASGWMLATGVATARQYADTYLH